MTKPPGLSHEAKITSLYNELTDEKTPWFQGSSSPHTTTITNEHEPRESIEIQEHYYGLTNTEKLHHVKSIVSYTLKNIVDDSKWTLKVRF